MKNKLLLPTYRNRALQPVWRVITSVVIVCFVAQYGVILGGNEIYAAQGVLMSDNELDSVYAEGLFFDFGTSFGSVNDVYSAGTAAISNKLPNSGIIQTGSTSVKTVSASNLANTAQSQIAAMQSSVTPVNTTTDVATHPITMPVETQVLPIVNNTQSQGTLSSLQGVVNTNTVQEVALNAISQNPSQNAVLQQAVQTPIEPLSGGQIILPETSSAVTQQLVDTFAGVPSQALSTEDIQNLPILAAANGGSLSNHESLSSVTNTTFGSVNAVNSNSGGVTPITVAPVAPISPIPGISMPEIQAVSESTAFTPILPVTGNLLIQSTTAPTTTVENIVSPTLGTDAIGALAEQQANAILSSMPSVESITSGAGQMNGAPGVVPSTSVQQISINETTSLPVQTTILSGGGNQLLTTNTNAEQVMNMASTIQSSILESSGMNTPNVTTPVVSVPDISTPTVSMPTVDNLSSTTAVASSANAAQQNPVSAYVLDINANQGSFSTPSVSITPATIVSDTQGSTNTSGSAFTIDTSALQGLSADNLLSTSGTTTSVNTVIVDDYSQQYLSSLVNINAAGSIVPVLINITINLNSTVENLTNSNSINLTNSYRY